MKKLPLVIFGIKIEKSLFGKKPKSTNEDPVGAIIRGFSPLTSTLNKEELDNYYGDGYFEPFNVVQMQVFPGYMELALDLFVLEVHEWYNKINLGDIVDTNNGKAIVFGYELPENWEDLKLKVDTTAKKWAFTIVENGLVITVGLPPVAIAIPSSYWTNSTKNISTLKDLIISNISPNEFIGWLDYAESLTREDNEDGNRIFSHIIKSVIKTQGDKSRNLAYIYWRIAQANERKATSFFIGKGGKDKIVLIPLIWLKMAYKIYSDTLPYEKNASQFNHPKIEDIDSEIKNCQKSFSDVNDTEIGEIFYDFLKQYEI